MAINAAGIDPSGHANPNWRGGPILKSCEVCNRTFTVRRGRAAARFCSLQCTGVFQKGRPKRKRADLAHVVCRECHTAFTIPKSHLERKKCCSAECQRAFRKRLMTHDGNPNWRGGISRLPYPYEFRHVRLIVLKRDDFQCQGPSCEGGDKRLTAHHINYIKADCREQNLITLCSTCNSKANFDRDWWQGFYQHLMRLRHGEGD